MEKRQVICDTDVMIDFFDHNQKRHSSTQKSFEKINREKVVISAITRMELIQVAQNKEHLHSITKRLSDFDTTFINKAISALAIDLLTEYNLSHGLNLADSLIAATAIYTGFELFTYNTKDYKFIPALKLYK